MKILLTSTSFQDNPGRHQDLLNSFGFEIDTLRGPVKEEVLLDVIQNYGAVVCGDDEYTRKVLEKGKQAGLMALSKYGIGLDKVDLPAAEELGIKVMNCKGVNHTTVAEHVFAMLLSYIKNIIPQNETTKSVKWNRMTGTELYGKTFGIIGLGRVGKEVMKRAKCFGMNLIGYDIFWDEEFAKEWEIKKANSAAEVCSSADVISLNMNLTDKSANTVNEDVINNHFKKGAILMNTSRGGLVDEIALAKGLKEGKVRAYLTDVLREEPIIADCPLNGIDNVLITPHVGSRTIENVEKQGLMAVENLRDFFVERGIL